MKVYVAAKPNGAVVGVYKSVTEAENAVGRRCYFIQSDPGVWHSPDGACLQSFNLEPEQLRPKRGAVVNVQINYTGVDLEAIVKEAVDKALKAESEKAIRALMSLDWGYNG